MKCDDFFSGKHCTDDYGSNGALIVEIDGLSMIIEGILMEEQKFMHNTFFLEVWNLIRDIDWEVVADSYWADATVNKELFSLLAVIYDILCFFFFTLIICEAQTIDSLCVQYIWEYFSYIFLSL